MIQPLYRKAVEKAPSLGRLFVEALVRNLPPVLLNVGGEIARNAIRERSARRLPHQRRTKRKG